MLQNIMVDLGGRIAEEIIFKDVTTGASQDIKQASKLARAMVTQYGMSDRVGMIQYGSDEDEVFIGRDLAHTKSYGNEIADVIDEEVKRIVDECYTKAKISFWNMKMYFIPVQPFSSKREDRTGRIRGFV